MRTYHEDLMLVRTFLKENEISATDLARISKDLCKCGTCRFFAQHYSKDGQALDWGHCFKGNIQHSKKISTACCGFWEEDMRGEEE